MPIVDCKRKVVNTQKRRVYGASVILNFVLSSILVMLFLTGCSFKNYKHTQSKLVTLKTKLLKFNDLAYIRSDDDAVQLDLYAVGRAVERIEINNLVCVSQGCMQKSSFNAAYLSQYYPNELMQNILLAQPIFDKKNLLLQPDGFEQRVSNEHYNVIYKVSSKQTYFKDSQNHILIRIKDINE